MTLDFATCTTLGIGARLVTVDPPRKRRPAPPAITRLAAWAQRVKIPKPPPKSKAP